MPMRGPVTISGISARASSSNGGTSSASPSCSRVIPSAWQSFPGPEQSARTSSTPRRLRWRSNPSRRLQRPDQHSLRYAFLAADEIQAPVDAVRAVDVRVPGRAEHRRVPRRAPAIGMTGRILLVVRLHLDDPAADTVDEQGHSDQVRSNLVDAPREEVTLQHSPARRSGAAPGTRPRAAGSRQHMRCRRRRSRSAGWSPRRARPLRGSRATARRRPA